MKKFVRSFRYAYQGVRYAIATQINFRIHIAAAISIIAAGIYVDLSRYEWMWIIASIGIVLVVEMINTAIEVLVDLVSPSYNKKAGTVKDISAGAVLITAIVAVVIAAIIFIPKLV